MSLAILQCRTAGDKSATSKSGGSWFTTEIYSQVRRGDPPFGKKYAPGVSDGISADPGGSVVLFLQYSIAWWSFARITRRDPDCHVSVKTYFL